MGHNFGSFRRRTPARATEVDAPRRTSGALVWVAGAAGAALLVLGVNGTLAAWSTAIVANDTNTVAVANAVILQETGPGAVVCNSTDGAQSTVNVATCSTINKYGGTATPLAPGSSQSVSVTLKNTGTESGALTLQAGTCTSSGGTAPTPDVCGALQVKVECPSGTLKYPGSGTTSLTAFTTGTTTPASIGTLAVGASVSCVFTVSLPSATAPTYAGQTASQPLTWTLAGA